MLWNHFSSVPRTLNSIPFNCLSIQSFDVATGLRKETMTAKYKNGSRVVNPEHCFRDKLARSRNMVAYETNYSTILRIDIYDAVEDIDGSRDCHHRAVHANAIFGAKRRTRLASCGTCDCQGHAFGTCPIFQRSRAKDPTGFRGLFETYILYSVLFRDSELSKPGYTASRHCSIWDLIRVQVESFPEKYKCGM